MKRDAIVQLLDAADLVYLSLRKKKSCRGSEKYDDSDMLCAMALGKLVYVCKVYRFRQYLYDGYYSIWSREKKGASMELVRINLPDKEYRFLKQYSGIQCLDLQNTKERSFW